MVGHRTYKYPLTSLQGFAFYAPTNGMTFDYVGTLGDGDYGLPISASGTHPDGFHWNLFGNPYPSSLDWDAVIAVNGSAGTGNLALDAIYYSTRLMVTIRNMLVDLAHNMYHQDRDSWLQEQMMVPHLQ